MVSSYLFLVSILALAISASPLQPTFSPCESFYNPAPGINRFNVSNVYANLVSGQRATQLGLPGNGVEVLRVDLIGNVGAELLGYDETTNKLATLFTDTTIGGLSVYKSTSWVCNSLFPAVLPTPYVPSNITYCPLAAGPFGLNLSIPLYRPHALTTLSTQVRIVDTTSEARTLSCVNISFTPYEPDGWYYGLFLWLPVSSVIGFWVTSWGARFAAGWVVGSGVAEYGAKMKDQNGERELDKAGRRDARMRKWGTMLVSGLSGERLSVSSGLLRFVTPGLRDIMHHIQFCTVLVMIAVNWPNFAYPIVAQLAWADLVWNSTIVAGSSSPITTYPSNSTLPSAFNAQMTSELYPLYLDTSSYNPLLDLGTARPGMKSFATTIGLRPEHLFGTCLSIFAIIAAAIILVSILIWLVHAIAESFTPDRRRAAKANNRLSYASSSAGTSLNGDKLYDPKSTPSTPGLDRDMDQLPVTTSQPNIRNRGPSRFRRAWFRFKPKGEAGAFHAAALYGNLLRLILIFHLPITIFSTYQLVLGSRASIVSRVFAALALVFISILIPTGVMWKMYKTPSGKLYDATRTLLAMGTMYNHYVMEKQLYRICPLLASLITGIVVGAGQGSGIAQAAILILVELIMLVVPAIWYPWGEGASMGAASVFMGVIRVISALLVMLLSPVLAMTESARTWLAYTILIINGIAFLFFLFMLLTKLVEGIIRLSGGVHFDESTHPLDGGIFAAIADLDCLNGIMGGKAAARKRRKKGAEQLQRNVDAQATLTTQRMLDKNSLGVQRLPPGSPPYEDDGYSPNQGSGVGSGYFPVSVSGQQPPLGPPPSMKRLSSDSSHLDGMGGGGNIMDAWRPRPVSTGGYIAPGAYAPSAGLSLGQYPPEKRQSLPPSGPQRSPPISHGAGAPYLHNPYQVRPISHPQINEFGRPLSPPPVRINRAMPNRPIHPRENSSPVIIESYDSSSMPRQRPPPNSNHQNRLSGGPYSPMPNTQGGQGQYSTMPTSPNKRHSGFEPVELIPLRPPQMNQAIPKRRSLNDLKNEGETSEDDTTKKGGNKGKKGKSRMFFSRTAGDDTTTGEDSDDEPGPSRSRARYDEGEIGGKSKGWKEKLGIRRKKPEEDEEAKDENKARKDALANESGALFAGVDSPVKKRVGGEEIGGKKKGFVVNRQSGPSRSVPLAAPLSPSPIPASSSSTSVVGGEEPRSFRVKRGTTKATKPSSALPKSTQASPYGDQVEQMDRVSYPPIPTTGSGEGSGPTKSFRVIRQAQGGS